jgi:hypothetical protein
VLLSYENRAARSVHHTIWRPGVSINACCVADVSARLDFWKRLEEQLERLDEPPRDQSSGAVLLDRLEWQRAEIGKRVPYPTDDELVEMIADRMRGPATAAPTAR